MSEGRGYVYIIYQEDYVGDARGVHRDTRDDKYVWETIRKLRELEDDIRRHGYNFNREGEYMAFNVNEGDVWDSKDYYRSVGRQADIERERRQFRNASQNDFPDTNRYVPVMVVMPPVHHGGEHRYFPIDDYELSHLKEVLGLI